MRKEAAELLREALSLPPKGRAALADSLLESLDQEVDDGAELAFDARVMVLGRFPCLAVFRETAIEIEIVAIAHGRRRPEYWRERLSSTSH